MSEDKVRNPALSITLGLGLLGLDIFPPTSGKARLGKETVEGLILRYGDDVAEVFIKKGDKKIAEEAIKKFDNVAKSGKKISSADNFIKSSLKIQDDFIAQSRRNTVKRLSSQSDEISKGNLSSLSKSIETKSIEDLQSKFTIGGTKGVASRIKEIKSPSPFIRRKETTLLGDRIKNFSKGFKEGRKSAKNEVKSIQNEVIDLGVDLLPPALRGKKSFLTKIRNANNPDKLSKVLEDITKKSR